MSNAGDRSIEASGVPILVAMVLIGSTSTMAAKYAIAGLPIGLVPLVRYGVAGTFLLPILRNRAGLFKLVRDDWRLLTIAAALCIPINQAFFLQGTARAPTTHVGLLYATCPLVVLVLSAMLGHERMEPARLFGVTLSVAGVMVLAAGNVARPTADSKVVFEGDLLLVGAVLSWGGYLTLLKPLIRRYGSLNTLAGTFLMGFLLQLPIALAATRDWHRVSSAPASAWWALAYLAIVATGIGLACQNLALHRLDASYVATVGNMSPMLTILWGVIFLREAATPWLLAGAILTVAGVALTTRARLRQVKDSRAEPGRIASSRGARRGCRRIERGAALGAAFDRLARAGVQNQVSIRIGRNDGLLSHPKSVGLGNNR